MAVRLMAFSILALRVAPKKRKAKERKKESQEEEEAKNKEAHTKSRAQQAARKRDLQNTVKKMEKIIAVGQSNNIEKHGCSIHHLPRRK